LSVIAITTTTAIAITIKIAIISKGEFGNAPTSVFRTPISTDDTTPHHAK
jgi:hypothetical protein